ncbi:MAG: hypothetical protein A2782_02240 [Candidatus Blackburnbacteria bacterium RIFCSPHIGHO2_01_FULL_43_15b]|uniref:Thioredoxin domain-containing protein n=1 Tax=Candidatus Blackburnbacteria bacterium RIFCSPHIGHO2_01_FULL_43_15b TaxID=1797513 RepID=A0A1G1V078_9BACT|nr:MAG: hypothetical protein A2782_02240 [Candidatus Blackburnbacteria bacterium RIFCSPHIGHO2_01_FULL_43_15b]
MKKTIIWTLVILAMVGGAVGVWWKVKAAQNGPNLDVFAQCLKDKGATMYGAYWCSHCQNQKKLFGSSFAHVSYVECTQDVKKCEEQKIKGYPTWIFADGSRNEGEISLEDLASKTGCTLPVK